MGDMLDSVLGGGRVMNERWSEWEMVGVDRVLSLFDLDRADAMMLHLLQLPMRFRTSALSSGSSFFDRSCNHFRLGSGRQVACVWLFVCACRFIIMSLSGSLESDHAPPVRICLYICMYIYIYIRFGASPKCFSVC